jgi:hypothetical protein
MSEITAATIMRAIKRFEELTDLLRDAREFLDDDSEIPDAQRRLTEIVRMWTAMDDDLTTLVIYAAATVEAGLLD